jgi:hypothetical protein
MLAQTIILLNTGLALTLPLAYLPTRQTGSLVLGSREREIKIALVGYKKIKHTAMACFIFFTS